jgi:hypothetical protein
MRSNTWQHSKTFLHQLICDQSEILTTLLCTMRRQTTHIVTRFVLQHSARVTNNRIQTRGLEQDIPAPASSSSFCGTCARAPSFHPATPATTIPRSQRNTVPRAPQHAHAVTRAHNQQCRGTTAALSHTALQATSVQTQPTKYWHWLQRIWQRNKLQAASRGSSTTRTAGHRHFPWHPV